VNAPEQAAQDAPKPGGLPRLINVIGVPTPAQARRLLALLNLAGDLPDRSPAGEAPARIDSAA
jgi:hypothetical protein